MDLGLLVAVLSLLVTTLAETRSIWKDKQKEQIRSLGLSLVQLISILDEVIVVGDELSSLLAQVPLTDEEDRTRIAVLGSKWRILQLIDKQQKNLEALLETLQSPLTIVRGVPHSSVSDFIAILIPENFEQIYRVVIAKPQFLRATAWKLLEKEVPANWLGFAASLALHDFKNSIAIHKQTNEMKIELPHKIKVNILENHKIGVEGEIAGYDMQSYDLTKKGDLRRLLSLGSERISSLKAFREQLAKLVRESFSINDLIEG